MRFKLGHPSYTANTHYIFTFNEEIKEQVNRLGPWETISSAYDWPHQTFPYRGWTDTVNSLWWPRGADQFASCILLMDDLRADDVEAMVAGQVAAMASTQAPHPYLILQALLAPAEGDRPAERYEPAGLTADEVLTETELIAWKLYPLPPIRLTEVDPSDTYQGLWLLPLVDARYFSRSTPLYPVTGGGSDYATGTSWPLVRIDYRATPDWMPPLRAYPDDAGLPADYVAIADNGTNQGITGNDIRGLAADKQAAMENWRLVCRDVRSGYNAPEGDTQHTDFTGIVADYPDATDLDLETDSSYHEDARRLGEFVGNRIAGGNSDQTIVNNLVSEKLSFLFRVQGDDHYYNIVIQKDIPDPLTVADLSEDTDGLGTVERTHVPKIYLGVEAGTRYPADTHRDDLVVAAKQWALLYYRWRRKQCFIKFPGIAPVIPNGYAATIRWDFAATKFETTYVAVEGVEGTDDGFSMLREPRWGRIDGEGTVDCGTDGLYAWTEFQDDGAGGRVERDNGIVGTVIDVAGASVTNNPARSDNDKRAVPVGMIVWMKPGTPYLDGTTGLIFDHWRFTTDDLLQVVRLRLTGERNEWGHYGAVIRRWDPVVKDFEDSEVIWCAVLDS